ncbi:hypothetical protein NEOLI_005495, partial [Neolecta irregularis DAH-3]
MWAVVESFKKYWLELDEKNGALKSLLKHRDDGTYPNSFHRKFAQVKTSIPVAVDEAMDIDDDSDCPSRPAPQNPSLKKAKDDELVRLITETTGHVNRIRSALHDASVRRGIDQYFQEYVVSLEGREIGLFGGAWQAESILARKHLDEALIHTRQDLASIIAMRTINNKLKADKKAEAEARMAAKKVSRTVEEILKDQLSSTNKRLATLEKALKKKNDGGKKKGPKGKPKPKPKAGPGKGKGKGPQGKTPVNKKSKKISKKQKKWYDTSSSFRVNKANTYPDRFISWSSNKQFKFVFLKNSCLYIDTVISESPLHILNNIKISNIVKRLLSY